MLSQISFCSALEFRHPLRSTILSPPTHSQLSVHQQADLVGAHELPDVQPALRGTCQRYAKFGLQSFVCMRAYAQRQQRPSRWAHAHHAQRWYPCNHYPHDTCQSVAWEFRPTQSIHCRCAEGSEDRPVWFPFHQHQPVGEERPTGARPGATDHWRGVERTPRPPAYHWTAET